jgi:CRISPR-associated protein Cas5t
MTSTGPQALEVTVTTPVASFRNPLYGGVQVTLPCPPPATVGGMLAAAAGGWDSVDTGLRFAMAFHSAGKGVDYETYHPLDASGKKASPAPLNREFLAANVLMIWLLDDLEHWWHRLRRPVWPLRLGRSQDLVGLSMRRTVLGAEPGLLSSALIPDSWERTGGTPLRLPTAVSPARDRTRWETYRFDDSGRSVVPVPGSWSSSDGTAVTLLPPCHPLTASPR